MPEEKVDNEVTTNPPKSKEEEDRPSKQAKTMVEQSPDSEWPDAWLMPDGDCANQKAANKQEPNVPVTVKELKDLGIW